MRYDTAIDSYSDVFMGATNHATEENINDEDLCHAFKGGQYGIHDSCIAPKIKSPLKSHSKKSWQCDDFNDKLKKFKDRFYTDGQ